MRQSLALPARSRLHMTEILFETAENPIPEGARPGWLVASDGKKLRYALFPPTGRPIKGTVIILQGRNEYIEKYFETARELSSRGLFVLTFDLRGQGLSDRMLDDPKRGFVDSFEDYARDLELLIDEVALPDCRPPYYILGHSTGSLVALLAAPRLTNRIRRMVLSAPLIELAGVPFSPSTLRFLVGMLFNIGLGRMYLAGGPPGRAARRCGAVRQRPADRQRDGAGGRPRPALGHLADRRAARRGALDLRAGAGRAATRAD